MPPCSVIKATCKSNQFPRKRALESSHLILCHPGMALAMGPVRTGVVTSIILQQLGQVWSSVIFAAGSGVDIFIFDFWPRYGHLSFLQRGQVWSLPPFLTFRPGMVTHHGSGRVTSIIFNNRSRYAYFSKLIKTEVWPLLSF